MLNITPMENLNQIQIKIARLSTQDNLYIGLNTNQVTNIKTILADKDIEITVDFYENHGSIGSDIIIHLELTEENKNDLKNFKLEYLKPLGNKQELTTQIYTYYKAIITNLLSEVKIVYPDLEIKLPFNLNNQSICYCKLNI